MCYCVFENDRTEQQFWLLTEIIFFKLNNKVLIIDCGSSKTPNIVKCLNDLLVVHDVSKMEQLNYEVILSYKAIIISGSPILLSETDPAPYLNYFNFYAFE